MENKTLHSFETRNGSKEGKRTPVKSSPLKNSKTTLPYHQILVTEDILVAEDFLEEEIFILREEYVCMEEEYVMWQEKPASYRTKNSNRAISSPFEAEGFTIPE